MFEENSVLYLKQFKKNLSVATLNINSAVSKINDVFFLLNQQLVDILFINETKLDEKDDISQLEHPSYSILRRDRLINKGEVL